MRSKLQDLRDPELKNTAKRDTLVDYRSLEEWRGQEQGPEQSCQSKGNIWAGAKATYGSAPGCTAGVAGRALACLSNRPSSRNKDCWGETRSTWKSGTRVSLPTVQSQTCRHLQWDLILGLILFQHLFQCLGWHPSSLWMTSSWERVNNTLRQWVMRNPASTKPKAKSSSWDGITPCNTPRWGLHG